MKRSLGLTKKDFYTIQRMLGLIQGAALALDSNAAAESAILDALETIDAILDKEVMTEDET